MKREWLASVDGVDKMKSADRERAWQRHLHNTSPRCEKAIRLAIGHGVGDVDALMEIVHTGSLQNLHLRTAGRALVALARPSEDTGFQGLKERCFRLEVLSYFLPAGSKWRPVGLANVDSAVAAPRHHESQPQPTLATPTQGDATDESASPHKEPMEEEVGRAGPFPFPLRLGTYGEGL